MDELPREFLTETSENLSVLDRAAAAPSPVQPPATRVNLDAIESLMAMVSELVLTSNQLMQALREREDSELAAPLRRLSQVTSELRDGVMKTRMQPIGNAWAKLPRIVRDLARDLGKKIELKLDGAETELDGQVLELIRDPLIHMVRSAADHGIEMPQERRRQGKPDAGTISLSARCGSGAVIVELDDDGNGIDVERIRQMAVVRANIEKIGGAIELRSLRGHGSRFVIRIPPTLAIFPALIVDCAGQRGLLDFRRRGHALAAATTLRGASATSAGGSRNT